MPNPPHNPPPEQVWDMQEGESAVAFEAFKYYRDLGLTRNLSKVAEKTGKAYQTVAIYSHKYSWAMRVAAWDKEQDRQEQQWLLDERKKAVTRHVRQAQSLQSKWIQRLQQLDPSELSVSEVIRYAEIATKLEREALGMAGTTVDVNLSGEVAHVEALSPEDTRLRMQELHRELQERMAEQEAERAQRTAAEPADDETTDQTDED